MSTQIDSLSIRIKTSATAATRAIDKITQSLENLQKSAGLDRIAKSFEKISGAVNNGMKNAPSTIKKAAKAANSFAKSADNAADSSEKLSGSLGGVLSNLAGFAANAFGIHTVAEYLKQAYDAGIQWDGISARFGDGFGDQADEVYAHVMKLSDALYINDQAFMQYAGNFATLARGFGVAEHAIADISVGLTELAYDIYAKNNDFYSFEEAMDAVRSAIVGEVEPIRRAGISITEATLKEVAAANGITTSVENMTEAQKSMLRYKAMIDQAYASGTVGTYAEELGTAEGMSRALKQQLLGLVQTLGGAFLPIITAIMPYLQAFVSLITMAVKAIAGFFGIEIKTPTWSGGMDNLGSSAGSATEKIEGTTGALEEAGQAAKKLKDYTMGFDELNVINPPDESAGSGGGGGGGGGGVGDDDLGLDFDSLWTDEIINKATAKAKEIFDGVLGFLEKVKPYLNDIFSLVAAIGAGIAAWKVVGFIEDIKDAITGGKVQDWFKNNKLKVGISLLVVSALLGLQSGYALGYEGPTWENIIKALITTALAVAGGLLTFGTGPLGWIVGLGVGIIANLIGFTLGRRDALLDSAYGEITLTAEQIKMFINDAFGFDVEARIELIGTTVENQRLAKRQLIQTVTELQAGLKKIQLGVEISESDLSSLQGRAESAIASLNELLKANGKTVELAVELVPPTAGDGTDMSANVLSMFSLSNETITTAANEIGKEFTYWIGEGMKNGMTTMEREMILEYGQWFTRIANALTEGKIEGEYSAKMQVLFSDLTRDTVGAVLEESKKMEEELREMYTTLQIEAQGAAQANRDALIELEAYYREMGEDDMADAILLQIEEANKALENWDIAKSVDTAMENAREPMRQMWITGFRDVYSDAIANIDTTDAVTEWEFLFSKTIQSVDWNDPVDVKLIADDFKATIDDAIKEATNGDPAVAEAMEFYNISGWDMLGADVQKQLYNTLLQYMDPVHAKEMLETLGYDTTAIFADGMESGIPEATTAATEVTENVKTELRKHIPVTADIGGETVDAFAGKMNEKRPIAAETANSVAVDIGAVLKSNIPTIGATGGEMVDSVSKQMKGKTPLALSTVESLMKDMGAKATTGAETAGAGASTMFVDMFNTGVTTADIPDNIKANFDVWEDVTIVPASKSLGSNTVGGFVDSFNTGLTQSDIEAEASKYISGLGPSLCGSASGLGSSVAGSFSSGFSSALSKGVNSALASLESTFNSALSKLDSSGTNKGTKVHFSGMQYVAMAASGGFVDEGQMFIAREAGPELVGSMNGHTAVANNDQIVEGISAGVYNAVVAAMSAGSGNNSAHVNVYLDGKQITAAVEKRQRERGATIMTGGVTFGY